MKKFTSYLLVWIIVSAIYAFLKYYWPLVFTYWLIKLIYSSIGIIVFLEGGSAIYKWWISDASDE